MNGNFKSLENGLQVSFDWLSFTITEINCLDSILALFGYSRDDFNELPHGGNGYKSQLRLNGSSLSVYYDGREDMGVHIQVPGSAISELIRSFKSTLEVDTPFGQAYEIDFESTFMRELISSVLKFGHFTRIDLAVDDIGASYFTTDDICDFWSQNRIVTRFRSIDIRTRYSSFNVKTTHTVYFGNRKSDIFFRIYDKQLEQNGKNRYTDVPMITTPWVRWEMECKGSYADSVAKEFLNGSDLGDLAVGILSHYFRIINLDDSNRSRCSSFDRWQDFIRDVSPLKLFVPQEEKTLEDKKAWINKQVAPTFAAILLADGGSLEFFEKISIDGLKRMKKNLRRLVDYTLYDSSSGGGDGCGDSFLGS